MRLQKAVRKYEAQRPRVIEALRRAGTNGEPYRSSEPDALHEIRELTESIEQFGCVIKDYASGLVDFPSFRDGREVYLCWKLGEGEVQSWHELEAGFAGRKPLDEPGLFSATGP